MVGTKFTDEYKKLMQEIDDKKHQIEDKISHEKKILINDGKKCFYRWGNTCRRYPPKNNEFVPVEENCACGEFKHI